MKVCRLEGNSNSLECPEEGGRALGSDYLTVRPDNPEKIEKIHKRGHKPD